MIDLTKYNLGSEDVEFLGMIRDDIELGNEIHLQYGERDFIIDHCMNMISVYAYNEDLGFFEDFDDLLLNFKLDDTPMIELIGDMDFA